MLPEELLKCSNKELINLLDNKNIFTAKYLISKKNNIYISGGTKKNQLFYKNINQKYWYFDHVSEIKQKFSPLSSIGFKNLKENSIYDIVDSWNYDKFFKIILNRTIEHYGEDFVEGNIESNQITIYFPEIIISNSVEQSHVMRNIYLVLGVNNSSVYIAKMYRTTYSQEEVDVNYIFSHAYPSKPYNYTDSFCYGSDNPMRDIVDKMQKNKKNSIKNISLFLPMIQEYLSWESLEGVPYIKIDRVLCSQDKYSNVRTPNFDMNELLIVVKNNISSFSYDYNLGQNNNYNVLLSKKSINNIKEVLGANFPDLCFKSRNTVSVVEKEISNLRYSDHVGDKVITFKGEDKFLEIFPSTKIEDNLPIEIHSTILQRIKEKIELEFSNFLINKYTYEH